MGKEKQQPSGIPRRSFLKSCGSLAATVGAFSLVNPLFPLAVSAAAKRSRRQHIAVIGAGAFGGWTALHLLRRGMRATLLDAWGPGNARASSGGETRVIRATYGPDRVYVEMVLRSLELWRENQEHWQRPLYRRTGVLWLVGADDRYEQASLPLLEELDVAFEVLTPAEAGKRYPQVNFSDVQWAIFEPEAGYLNARPACQAVLDAFLSEGGEYREALVEPGTVTGGEMRGLRLADGSSLLAEQYVFACGPWLGKLFPKAIGDLIQPTRQEVLFFGTPAGDARFVGDALPVWIDNGARLFYGIPSNQGRGFKVADDTRGAPFDPTAGERTPSAEGIKAARDYLALRFPALKDAPLLEARVCQYENTPDQHFIIDRHPEAANVWLVGGGSGHGFKHGPALGERVAEFVLEEKSADPFFSLSRFSKSSRT